MIAGLMELLRGGSDSGGQAAARAIKNLSAGHASSAKVRWNARVPPRFACTVSLHCTGCARMAQRPIWLSDDPLPCCTAPPPTGALCGGRRRSTAGQAAAGAQGRNTAGRCFWWVGAGSVFCMKDGLAWQGTQPSSGQWLFAASWPAHVRRPAHCAAAWSTRLHQLCPSACRAALWNLAYRNNANRKEIVRAGAIPPLVRLLTVGCYDCGAAGCGCLQRRSCSCVA